jgi:tetratricopeptide (TPR) repeat protein
MTRRPAILAAGLLAALAAGLLAAPPAGAAEPFYDWLYNEGVAAAEQGSWDNAARDLRLAVFGLLDEPPRLAAALARLAIAQAELGDRPGFEDSFRRILEVEERFAAYTAADLPAEARSAFEERASTLIPLATLRSSEAFRPVAERRLAAELAKLPPKERRQRLEAHVASEPQQARWRIELAGLELAEGHHERAAPLATAALAPAPADPAATCTRGIARAGAGACAAAVTDLAGCPRARTEPAAARGYLGCLVELERWQEAAALAAALPAAVRAERPVDKLARRAERQAAKLAAKQAAAAQKVAATAQETEAGGEAAPADATPAPAPDVDSGPGTDAAPRPATELGGEDRGQLARVREMLGAARTVGDLAEAEGLATDLADRNPGSPEAQLLAAEVAYRMSRWSEAADYFNRAGTIDPVRSDLLFYMAVALYESNDSEAARTALRAALPRLKRTAFVNAYIEKILPNGSP